MSYREYKMTYEKPPKDDKSVERRHTHLDLGDEPIRTPERVRYLVANHPKHKELKKQGWRVAQFGKHDDRAESFGRKVVYVKEETEQLDEDARSLRSSITKHLGALGYKRGSSESTQGAHKAWLDHKKGVDIKKVHSHVRTLDSSAKLHKGPFGYSIRGKGYEIEPQGKKSLFVAAHRTRNYAMGIDEEKIPLPTEYGNEYSVRKIYDEERLDEISIKKAINTYRDRELKHTFDMEDDSPDAPMPGKNLKKAAKDLHLIRKKFGNKIATQARRSEHEKQYPGSETRPHHVGGYDHLDTVMHGRGENKVMKSGPRKGKLDKDIQRSRKISTKAMVDYYHNMPKQKLPEEIDADKG